MALFVFMLLLASAVALKPQSADSADLYSFHRSQVVRDELKLKPSDNTTEVSTNTSHVTRGVNQSAFISHARKNQSANVSASIDHTGKVNTAAAPASTNLIRLQSRNDSQQENNNRQHEILLNGTASDLPAKSKTVAALISIFGLGCFGVDRCYLGNMCLGITKGLTLGGLGVWAILDALVLMINCLERADTIETVSFRAQWDSNSINTAYTIGVVQSVLDSLLVCCMCSLICLIRTWAAASKNKPKPGRRSFSGPASAPKMAAKPKRPSEAKMPSEAEAAEAPTSVVPPAAAEEVKSSGEETAAGTSAATAT